MIYSPFPTGGYRQRIPSAWTPQWTTPRGAVIRIGDDDGMPGCCRSRLIDLLRLFWKRTLLPRVGLRSVIGPGLDAGQVVRGAGVVAHGQQAPVRVDAALADGDDVIQPAMCGIGGLECQYVDPAAAGQ